MENNIIYYDERLKEETFRYLEKYTIRNWYDFTKRICVKSDAINFN